MVLSFAELDFEGTDSVDGTLSLAGESEFSFGESFSFGFFRFVRFT